MTVPAVTTSGTTRQSAGGPPVEGPGVQGVRVVLLVDTTGSMGQYCTSLSDTLPQLFSLLRVLFAGRAEVDVVAYKDYCDGAGLCTFCYSGEEEAMRFAAGLRATGGGDAPEAAKTALNEVVRRLRAAKEAGEAKTLVLHYTDAPPHHARAGGGNCEKERAALAGVEPGFDWVGVCRAMRAAGTEVYTFVPGGAADVVLRYYALLGRVVRLRQTTAQEITRASMCVVLQLMGQSCDVKGFAGRVVQFERPAPLGDEGLTEEASCGYLGNVGAGQGRGGGVEAADVEALVAMGFTEGMGREAMRRARGNVEAAIELLVSGQVGEAYTQMAGMQPLGHGGLEVAAAEGWRRDLGALAKRFAQDEAFQGMVFRTLRELLVPQHPTRALALTYNKVLGTLWRLACRRREDERLAGLADALGQCVTALRGDEQQQLRQWVDESYDSTEEISREVAAAGLGEGVFVLHDVACELPSKEDMRSLVHAPTPAVLAAVQRLLTSVEFLDGAAAEAAAGRGELPHTADGVPSYVPASLGDGAVFALLPHLALAGLKVTLRPACVMAVLAYLSGNAALAAGAVRLLERVKGKWIPPLEKVDDYPEVLSAGFVRLVVRVPQFLTADEADVFRRVAHVLKVRAARKLRVEVEVGYRVRKGELYADRKVCCGRCGAMRSATLTKGGVCGPCHDNYDGPNREPDAAKSFLVECRSCCALYAVVNVERLNVEPKCWYCRREGRPAPAVTCTTCRNKFVAPDADADAVEGKGKGEGAAAAHTCAECAAHGAKQQVRTEEAELQALEGQNSGLLEAVFGFGTADLEALWGTLGTYKLWTRHPEVFAARAVGSSGDDAGTALGQLRWNGHEVHNAGAVCETVRQRVARNDLRGTCNLCFEEMGVARLGSACGRCDNVACGECLGRWYGALRPGRLYCTAQGQCPFCKRRPRGQLLAQHNRLACSIVTGKRRVAEGALRADMHYAWCERCYKVKEAMPRECGTHADLDKVKGFKCDECALAEVCSHGDPRARECPACKAPTVKTSGCNHISCVCGCSWCWECGKDCSAEDVYEHMMAAHGSIGIGGGDGDDEEDDDGGDE